MPLPLPSWRPQSPLHFHWFPITILKVTWINFPQLPLPLPSWNVFLNWKGNNFEYDGTHTLQFSELDFGVGCDALSYPPHLPGVRDPKITLSSFRKALDTFKLLRHIMRAIVSVWPKFSHRCVSLKESPLKCVQILKHATRKQTEQTSMRARWFKHIAL